MQTKTIYKITIKAEIEEVNWAKNSFTLQKLTKTKVIKN
jgi:hypothetical protein